VEGYVGQGEYARMTKNKCKWVCFKDICCSSGEAVISWLGSGFDVSGGMVAAELRNREKSKGQGGRQLVGI